MSSPSTTGRATVLRSSAEGARNSAANARLHCCRSEWALVSRVSGPGDNNTSARARQKRNRRLSSLRRRKAKAGSPMSLRVTKPSTSVGQSPRSTRCFVTFSTVSASSPSAADSCVMVGNGSPSRSRLRRRRRAKSYPARQGSMSGVPCGRTSSRNDRRRSSARLLHRRASSKLRTIECQSLGSPMTIAGTASSSRLPSRRARESIQPLFPSSRS